MNCICWRIRNHLRVAGFVEHFSQRAQHRGAFQESVLHSVVHNGSIIACTIYILATHTFDWASYGILCGAVVGLTGAVYTIYENTGIRKLWKTFVLNNIAKLFKAISGAIVTGTLTEEKIKKLAIDLGSQALTELVAEAKAVEDSKQNNVAENVQQ